mgnify:CR=1 FL=1
MLASFVDLSLLKTINLLNLWLHVTPRSLRRLRASQGLIPGPIVSRLQVQCDEHWRQLDLGSVSTGYGDRPVARAIKIKHAGLNLTGRRKDIMNRQKILIEHWRWLQVNGYKLQASSCKQQAASLTRKQYRIIREYESKRSKKNN